MEHLNDDCLYLIFSYLNIQDLMALEEVSERFHEPAQISYRGYTEFDINKEECNSVVLAEKMFSRVGPYLRTLRGVYGGAGKFNRFTEEMVGIFLQNCPNVEHIDLLDVPLEDFAVLKDLQMDQAPLRHLKSISLLGCRLGDTNDYDVFFRWFTNAEKLEKVDLSRNQKISGACLKYFEHVKEMSLKYSISLERHYFIDFCKRNQNLTCLKIGGCTDIDQRWIRVMQEELRNLTELYFSCPDFPDSIDLAPLADLPKLEKLHLNSCNSVSIALLERVALRNKIKVLEYSLSSTTGVKQEILCASVKIRGLKKYSTFFWPPVNDRCLREAIMDNLEELHIPGSEVTNEGIYHFIMQHPTLKFVDLKCCAGITDAFAEMILPDLYDRFKTLRINANYTTMSKRHKQILCGKNRV